MKTYEIKITGSGTIDEIKLALDNIIADLIQADPDELDGWQNEDETLFVEMELKDEETFYIYDHVNDRVYDTDEGEFFTASLKANNYSSYDYLAALMMNDPKKFEGCMIVDAAEYE